MTPTPADRVDACNRETVAEHRQAAARLLARGIVPDDVPVLGEHAHLGDRKNKSLFELCGCGVGGAGDVGDLTDVYLGAALLGLTP